MSSLKFGIQQANVLENHFRESNEVLKFGSHAKRIDNILYYKILEILILIFIFEAFWAIIIY